jgi:hypothetical protein
MSFLLVAQKKETSYRKKGIAQRKTAKHAGFLDMPQSLTHMSSFVIKGRKKQNFYKIILNYHTHLVKINRNNNYQTWIKLVRFTKFNNEIEIFRSTILNKSRMTTICFDNSVCTHYTKNFQLDCVFLYNTFR